MVVGVLVQLSSQNVDRVFDYLVPEHLIPSIKVGVRVLVPFGKQNLEGFILEIKTNSDRELKEIYSMDVCFNRHFGSVCHLLVRLLFPEAHYIFGFLLIII